VGLARVLDHDESVAASELENPIHVSALPVNMNRDHCSDRRPPLPVKWSAGFAVQEAFALKILLQLGRIQAIRSLVDVNKIRLRSRLGYSFCSRNKRMGHRDNDIAGLDARCHQGKTDRVCAARDSDAVRRIAEARVVSLKFLNHRPANKTRCSQCLLKDRNQFVLELLVKADQIQKRNFLIF